ncbi:MAG: NADH-quinone oxidoreductase subunit NuoK [Thermoflexales bacterium]|nr:NADH-quinone oxidoreductase subunit NuoK [Thermoflexales bacterium]
MLETNYFVVLAGLLFAIGAVTALTRRNAIMMFMAIELMLNAANLALVAFARQWQQLDGQLFVFFVMTVAASEVAVGLALIVSIFKSRSSTDVDDLHSMKG